MWPRDRADMYRVRSSLFHSDHQYRSTLELFDVAHLIYGVLLAVIVKNQDYIRRSLSFREQKKMEDNTREKRFVYPNLSSQERQSET